MVLSAHGYRHNGPDRDLVASPFESDEVVRESVKLLIDEVRRKLNEMKGGESQEFNPFDCSSSLLRLLHSNHLSM